MNSEQKAKLSSISERYLEHEIVVTHVTIRQSIFFLILKLMLIEMIAGLFIIGFHTLLFTTDIVQSVFIDTQVFNIPFFIILVLLKTYLMIVVTIMWIEEYYEITPKEVIHKNGFIFKVEERHKLSHIGSVTLDQGFLGRVFNYGTLRLYNWTQEKNIYLYLIHNPRKYHHILETILPEADEGKHVFREHVIEEEKV